MYRMMLRRNLLQASTKSEKITCLKPCVRNRVKVDNQQVCLCCLCFFVTVLYLLPCCGWKCDSSSSLNSRDFPFQISAEFQCSAKVKGQVLAFLPAHGDQRSRLPRCLTMATYRTKQQKVTVYKQTASLKKMKIDIDQFCLWGTAPVRAARWSTQE